MSDRLTPDGEYTDADIPGEPETVPPLTEGEYTDSELPVDAVVPKDDDVDVEEVDVEFVEVEDPGLDPGGPGDTGLRR
ncbi:hypothetical protein GE115_13630 [Agromyces sp. CFH 90414]|uniref:Uncharacterized protein n=1 Tax=Agromyces agglutinans TaxID=2662258 RepID=A0A6I2FAQ6_9MICO|nr:hypothetical protein [Agromyces agglutinans]MRG60897.1 hypothetical protein [Agromyces agglutinans]